MCIDVSFDTHRGRRTNIELDDELVAEAMAMTGLLTKRATVEEALRVLLQHRRKTALANLACLGWEGDLDAMRECRIDDLAK